MPPGKPEQMGRWIHSIIKGFPGSSVGKESACDTGDPGLIPGWVRLQQSTPVFLPAEFHGQRSLIGYSLWTGKESDITELLRLLRLHSIKSFKLPQRKSLGYLKEKIKDINFITEVQKYLPVSLKRNRKTDVSQNSPTFSKCSG